MPKNNRTGRPRRERHLRIREDRRREPDLTKIAKAVIALALAQAEADAAAQQQADTDTTKGDDHA